MSNPLNIELHQLNPSAIVDLFELRIPEYKEYPAVTLYFHCGVNQVLGINMSGDNSGSVVWKGVAYQYIPIEMTGFEVTGQGSLPSPTARVSNVTGAMSASVLSRNDMVGSRLIRRRTFARFLDPINFAGGYNPNADPSMGFPEEVFYIDQKAAENPFYVEFKLVSSLDLSRVKLPGRTISSNLCLFTYRKEGCEYTGGYDGGAVLNEWRWDALKTYDPDGATITDWVTFELNTATGVWTPYRCRVAIAGNSGNLKPSLDPIHWRKDYCLHNITDCKKHFGAEAILPFGGFPGAARISQ
jgi:lambda family phage minor tail protein L